MPKAVAGVDIARDTTAGRAVARDTTGEEVAGGIIGPVEV